MDRMAELEEMIRAGWGDTRGSKIPADWRNRRPKPEVSEFFTENPQAEGKPMIDGLAAQVMRNEYQRMKIGRPPGRRDSRPRRPRPTFEMRAAAMRERTRRSAA